MTTLKIKTTIILNDVEIPVTVGVTITPPDYANGRLGEFEVEEVMSQTGEYLNDELTQEIMDDLEARMIDEAQHHLGG